MLRTSSSFALQQSPGAADDTIVSITAVENLRLMLTPKQGASQSEAVFARTAPEARGDPIRSPNGEHVDLERPRPGGWSRNTPSGIDCTAAICMIACITGRRRSSDGRRRSRRWCAVLFRRAASCVTPAPASCVPAAERKKTRPDRLDPDIFKYTITAKELTSNCTPTSIR